MYTSQYLQFGTNNTVPGYDNSLQLTNPFDPIPQVLADPKTDELWCLMFSYESGNFYKPGDMVPGQDGATVMSWYAKGGPGDPALAIYPFIIGQEPGFLNAAQLADAQLVDFNEPTTTDNSVDTATMPGASVTATVHKDIPQLSTVVVSAYSTSNSMVIKRTMTGVDFDRIFVFYSMPSISPGNPPNTITVLKNQTCLALAVFKPVSVSSSTSVGKIIQPSPSPSAGKTTKPKIPWHEWIETVPELVVDVIREQGEIFEYVSPKLLAQLDRESLDKAIASINTRIERLNKLKSAMSTLAAPQAKSVSGS
jgi:hypothetical protein